MACPPAYSIPTRTMKRTFLGAVLLTAPLWVQRPPEIPYESVPDPD